MLSSQVAGRSGVSEGHFASNDRLPDTYSGGGLEQQVVINELGPTRYCTLRITKGI